jgi:predicted DNA-binding transcriptional regulator AlpA
MTTMSLIFTHLTPALEDARTLPADKLPRLLGDIEEVRTTALARLSAPAPAPAAPDELLTCAQAAERLQCSRDYLYKADLPFKRKLGRSLRFSSAGITAYLARQK